MNRIVITMIAMATMLLAGGCCKEDPTRDRDCSGEEETRFELVAARYTGDDGEEKWLDWQKGETVNLNGKEVQLETSGRTIEIDGKGIVAKEDGYWAIADGQEVQQIEKGFRYEQKDSAILNKREGSVWTSEITRVGYSSSRNIPFEVGCSIGKIVVRNNGVGNVALRRMTLRADQPLCGAVRAAYSSAGWKTEWEAGIGDRITVAPSSQMVLQEEGDTLLFALPPMGAVTLQIDVVVDIDGIGRRYRQMGSIDVALHQGGETTLAELTYRNGILSGTEGLRFEEEIADGSEERPYPIETEREWYHWARQAGTEGKHLRIERDLTVEEAIADFGGIVEGNGHTITLNNCALIGQLNSGGCVTGLTLSGKMRSGETLTEHTGKYGSVAEVAREATISQCTSRVEIAVGGLEDRQYYIGGIVGQSNSSVLDGNSFEGSIQAEGRDAIIMAGGIAGSLSVASELRNCSGDGTIEVDGGSRSATHSAVGGLVGSMAGTAKATNSYSLSDIGADRETLIGGLVGQITNRSNELSNSYHYGTLSSSETVGGISHTVKGTVKYCYYAARYTGVVAGDGSSIAIERLQSATTIEGGRTDGLADKLNQNIGILGLTQAQRWGTVEGAARLTGNKQRRKK